MSARQIPPLGDSPNSQMSSNCGRGRLSFRCRETAVNDSEKLGITIWLPRCPRCGGSNPRHYGTRKNAQGETIRYYQCRKFGCNTKFPARVLNADIDDQDDGASDPG